MSSSAPAPTPINDSPTEWVRDHVQRYVSTNGADGHDWNGVPCLLLTTKGRRSGTWQRSALIYGVDPDTNDIILVASKGGAPENPLWYANLVAEPRVWVQVGAETTWATATTIDPVTDATRRARLWRVMSAIWPGYDEYQTKADVASRIIPVVTVRRS
jgi:deazaflavin-dependent oxidoreductase (nitroreductase family)